MTKRPHDFPHDPEHWLLPPPLLFEYEFQSWAEGGFKFKETQQWRPRADRLEFVHLNHTAVPAPFRHVLSARCITERCEIRHAGTKVLVFRRPRDMPAAMTDSDHRNYARKARKMVRFVMHQLLWYERGMDYVDDIGPELAEKW